MNRRALIGTLILAAAFLVAAAVVDHSRTLAEAEHFERALRYAHIDEVVRDGNRAYTVKDGVVRASDGTLRTGTDALPLLRLAYAKTLAKRSPLMTLAGNAPEDLRRLIEGLSTLRGAIAEVQTTSKERALVVEALYPLNFLGAITDTEEARLAFLQQGDAASLRAYLRARARSFSAYRADAERFAAAFEALVPHTTKRFSLGEHLVSYGDMRDTLQRLPAATSAAFRKSRAQEECLRGRLSSCDPLELELLLPLRPPRTEVSAAQRRQADDIVHILRQEPLESRVQDELGAIMVALSGSGCIDTGASAPLYTVRDATSTVDGASYRKVMFVGDIRFIESQNFPDVPFYRFFAEQGVRYIPTSPLLHYVCPEFGHELSNLFAADAISAFAEHLRLSAKTEGSASSAFRSLEAALRRGSTGNLVEETAAHTYLALAVGLVRNGTLGRSDADAVTELLLQVNARTAGWTDALQFLVDTDAANARILKKGVPVDLEAPYVFFFRSPLLFLYMADNASVSAGLRIGGLPASDAQRDPYVYYSQLPHTPALVEKMADDVAAYRKVHQQSADTPLSEAFAP